jgi:Leucine-rich repeat (LRR) protein
MTSDCFETSLNLRYLSLKYNKIESLPLSIYNLQFLQVLDVSNNKLNSIEPQIC